MTARTGTEKTERQRKEDEEGGRRGRKRNQTEDVNQNINLMEAVEGEGGSEGSEEEDQVSEEEPFWERHYKKLKYYAGSGGGGGDDDEDAYVEARIPKDILKKIMPVAIKEGLSMRQVVMLTSAFIVGSGVDLQNFTLSTATCHAVIAQQCSSIGDEAINEFAEEVKKNDDKVVCHFDGKIIEEDFSGRRQSQHRLVSLLSSPSHEREQLLGVAPLAQESGYAIALELFGQLLNLECDGSVAAAVFDSTAINTGAEEGASIHLQRLLDRPILEIECGHHVQVQVNPENAVRERFIEKKEEKN